MKCKQLQMLIERREKIGRIGALDFLINFYQRQIAKDFVKQSKNQFYSKIVSIPEDLAKYKKLPRSLPESISLPSLVGVANDYTHLIDKIEETTNAGVSIIVPTYNRKKILEKTLIGIVNQNYDLQNIEVIIADDGSSDDTLSAIEKYHNFIDIKYVWHPDVGYTPAIARNHGVSLAKNKFIILLDADMYPSRSLVREYVKYHKIIDQVVLIGVRDYKDLNNISTVDLLKDPDLITKIPNIITNNSVAGVVKNNESIDWRLPIIAATDKLKTEPLPFRMLAAGNVAFSKLSFDKVGGFDERFNDWGYEDGELGFRFFNNGLYMIPELSAVAHHQEPEGGINETDREAGKNKTAFLYGSLCPYYRHLLDDKNNNYEVPTVSIYIPAYNAEATIVDAIESVLNQTYRDLEVCICDDGSVDGTAEILRTLYSEHPRVRWITQENKGIGAASNAAVALCRGIFVGQLDSDDILASDVVEKCVPHLQSDSNVGLVYTTYENQNVDGSISPGYNYPVFTREKFMSAMIVHHFRMFRRRDWARVRFNENIKNAVDYDFYLKLSEISEVKHLNIIGYRRRLHGENTSIKHNKTQNINAAKAVNNSLRRQGIENIICFLQDENSPVLSFMER